MSSFNPHVLPVAGKGFAVNVHGPHRPQRVSAMGSNAYTKLFLDKDGPSYNLISYSVQDHTDYQGSGKRTLIWTCQQHGCGKIKHTIDKGINGIPHTYHSIETLDSNRNVVTFHARTLGIKHAFVFEGTEYQPTVPNPSYHFLYPNESVDFQGRVRGRKLLETFDTDSICISTTGRLRVTHVSYARMEPVKLWRRTDTAITFFKNCNEAELCDNGKLILKFHHPPERRLSLPRLTAVTANQSAIKVHDGIPKTNKFVDIHWDALEIQFTIAADAERFATTCWDSRNERGVDATEGPYLVSPFTDGGDALPQAHQPGSSSPTNSYHSEDMRTRRGAIQKWWNDFNDNRRRIFPIIYDGYAPIKIAILDTGVDITNPWINERWQSTGLYRDFLEDDDAAIRLRTGSSPYSERYVRNDVLGSLSLQRQDQPIDVAGHGTHLAGIVLQLAPDAKLCIGRVLEKKKKEEYEPGENLDANKTAKRVALAILYAVEEWKVKIISLSIGFVQADLDELSQQAMKHSLQYARQHEVVVFAAASNSGNRDFLAFPACKPDYVLGINSTDGNGGRSRFNPQNQDRHENLSILGEYIKSTWLQSESGREGTCKIGDSVWRRDEGTSQATAVAASVAVLILQFGRQYGVDRRLEKFEGVRSVLRAMAETKTGDGFYDMVPWKTVFRMTPDAIDRIKGRFVETLDKAQI